MDEQNYTCGVCFKACLFTCIEDHICIKEYCASPKDFFLNENQKKFFPKLVDGGLLECRFNDDGEKYLFITPASQFTIIENDIDCESNNCEKGAPSTSSEQEPIVDNNAAHELQVSLEEKLITAIHNRPPLWNHKLPLEQRRVSVKNNLWIEVTNALDNKLTVEQAKKKWHSLTCSRRHYLNKLKCANHSGAAASNIPKWQFVDQMSFLSDVEEGSSPTESNILNDSIDSSSDESPNVSSASESSEGRHSTDSTTASTPIGSKKKKLSKEESLQVIAESVAKNSSPIKLPPMPAMPPLPKPDKVEGFFIMIGHDLRDMTPRRQKRVMRKIQDLIDSEQ